MGQEAHADLLIRSGVSHPNAGQMLDTACAIANLRDLH